MNPSRPHSGGLPCSVCLSGETPSPEPEPLTGSLGALLSAAVTHVLQWRRAEQAAGPIQGTPVWLVLRSCWVVRARGAGPGLGGWREAELGVGAPGPCRHEAGRVPRWLGLPRLADQRRCRPQAPTQRQIWVPPPGACDPLPEGQRGHNQGLLLCQLHPGLDLVGDRGP